ncbi:hypothetical protein FHG87_019053 [Trinorchestia longiramus]|nr:hypothetical protein FHG87_019053 [Trinorchestia longiramus]
MMVSSMRRSWDMSMGDELSCVSTFNLNLYFHGDRHVKRRPSTNWLQCCSSPLCTPKLCRGHGGSTSPSTV